LEVLGRSTFHFDLVEAAASVHHIEQSCFSKAVFDSVVASWDIVGYHFSDLVQSDVADAELPNEIEDL
jgi:hypothetical protein